MKSLSVLVAALFLSSCASHLDNLKKIHKENSQNRYATVRIVRDYSFASGVIIGKDHQGHIQILSNAHICNPEKEMHELLSLAKQVVEGVDVVERVFNIVMERNKAGLENKFCDATAMWADLDDKIVTHPVVLVSTDYHTDLALYVTKSIPLSKVKIAKIAPNTRIPVVGTEVYNASWFDQTNPFVRFAWARAGLWVTPPHRTDPLVQTVLDITSGYSGSGVFDATSHELVGVINSEAVTFGNMRTDARTSFFIPNTAINSFLETYKEKPKHLLCKGVASDSKLDRPYCFGENLVCEVVCGEKPFVELFPHRRVPKKGSR